MEIQRYDMIAVTWCGEGWQELQREPEGEWMRHEDHLAALAAQQEEHQRQLERFGSIEEKSHLQTIDERDRAEEALSQAYYLVVGHSPEWSNLFGHDEAINDIDDAQKCLRAEVAAQQEEIDRLQAQWEEHTKHVGRFLTEMYQTMIDPLDDPEPSLKIAELCEMLLNQAREDREKLNRSPFNWPADWNKDSSLETWFPLTAEELTRIKAENAKLQARLDAMSAPVSDEDENYCAWLRMKNGSLSVCDSDTEGAFKVWRKSGIVRLLTGRIKENQHA